MTTGQKIHARRKALKMTLQNVGDKLGVTKAAIYKYEKDLVNIPVGVVDKLAYVLECSPAYLMGWNDDNREIRTPEELLACAMDNMDKLSPERLCDCVNFLRYMYPELFNNKRKTDAVGY